MKVPSPNLLPDGTIGEDLLKQLVYNEKMAELGRISAGVVHELNAPLSVIASASQMILRENGLSENAREMLERIGEEAQRLSQLTRGLLSFSNREDSGKVSDVNLTIGFVLDFIRFEAAQRAVGIIRKLDYRLPLVLIGGNTLKQILLNIVMNALHAMNESGGELLVETLADGETVCIDISDNGPGIPAEIMARIFEPYFTTKQEGVGTGLGLFVTRTLVEQVGGAIQVFSTVEAGTKFRIALRVVEAD